MPRKKPARVEYEYRMCSDGLERALSPFVPLPESMLPPRLRKPVLIESSAGRRKRKRPPSELRTA